MARDRVLSHAPGRVTFRVGRLARRHSTAAVLFHHVVAERLGLGPTDHKCLDLLRERGAMAGSDLCAITGLTSGAITGVVARLERAGYLRREPDPRDLPQPRISLVDLTGKTPLRILIAPQGYAGQPAFSPDGKTLAFGSSGAVHLFDLTK